MTTSRNVVDRTKFNTSPNLPYQLRIADFAAAMQDVYDFFYDVNSHMVGKGLQRLDDMLRPAIMSGVLSDMVTASLAKHSRVLTENQYHNGHPDLVVQRRVCRELSEGRRSGCGNQDHQKEGRSR